MNDTDQLNSIPALRGALCVACLMLAGAAAAQSPGQSLATDPIARLEAQLNEVSEERLKAIYIDCSNEAEQRLLGSGDAMACSVAYETLKRRVFGGDFGALFAWSSAQRATQTSARGKATVPASAR